VEAVLSTQALHYRKISLVTASLWSKGLGIYARRYFNFVWIDFLILKWGVVHRVMA
jgi:hypothetical protein